jgi:hypothetical protein
LVHSLLLTLYLLVSVESFEIYHAIVRMRQESPGMTPHLDGVLMKEGLVHQVGHTLGPGQRFG